MPSKALRILLAEMLSLDPLQLRARPVTGGCIARSYRLDTPGGPYFLKCMPGTQSGMLDAEAASLRALAATGTVRVPAVVGQQATESEAALVLEFIDLQPLAELPARQLGQALAQLHEQCAARYGWPADNWIGRSVQRNAWCDDWPTFFATQRLGVQLEMAATAGVAGSGLQALGVQLLEKLPVSLAGHRPQPSLLHGDLWSGNVAADCEGRPVIYDPASYYGDAETDLAMTRLFGALPEGFYAAYNEARSLQDGWQWRSELYQLYHILNHLNLFGGSYAAQAEHLLLRLLERAPC